MFYWRRQACMHQRQARSSSVTVSACTVPERQNRRVYHGKARVPTNQMQQHHYFLRAKIWNLPRNGRMPTNQMRAVPSARARVATKIWILIFTAEWRGPKLDECTRWWNVPVMGSPLVWKQSEAYNSRVKRQATFSTSSIFSFRPPQL